MIVSKKIDACNLVCPLPILKTKKALAELKYDEILQVNTTDPHAIRDFTAFTTQTGHTLLEMQKHGEQTIFFIKRRKTIN